MQEKAKTWLTYILLILASAVGGALMQFLILPYPLLGLGAVSSGGFFAWTTSRGFKNPELLKSLAFDPASADRWSSWVTYASAHGSPLHFYGVIVFFLVFSPLVIRTFCQFKIDWDALEVRHLEAKRAQEADESRI